ncbi:30S ribosomal protein S8 [Candidatus Woesearchaeota archaeon]|nr:30S ribosomal protein S8 [Candidatus Woesearchaeota archaeon]
MLNDPLANALSKIMNAERLGRTEVLVKPVSNTIKSVFQVLQDNHYLGEFKEIDDSKGNVIKVNLIGHINKCGAIKPRFNSGKEKFEFFEKRYLPAKDFGLLIVSTSQGILTHKQAKEKGIGGRMIAYCY